MNVNLDSIGAIKLKSIDWQQAIDDFISCRVIADLFRSNYLAATVTEEMLGKLFGVEFVAIVLDLPIERRKIVNASSADRIIFGVGLNLIEWFIVQPNHSGIVEGINLPALQHFIE